MIKWLPSGCNCINICKAIMMNSVIYLHHWNIFRISYILREEKIIQTLFTKSGIQNAFTQNCTNPNNTNSSTSSIDITTSTSLCKTLLCDFYITTAFTDLFSIYSHCLYRPIYLVMSPYSCPINKLEWSYLNCILLKYHFLL